MPPPVNFGPLGRALRAVDLSADKAGLAKFQLRSKERYSDWLRILCRHWDDSVTPNNVSQSPAGCQDLQHEDYEVSVGIPFKLFLLIYCISLAALDFCSLVFVFFKLN